MKERRAVAIGGGNMARAIIQGCDRSGTRRADSWVVVDPSAEAQAACAAIGTETVSSVEGARGDLEAGALVLLAVKPQMLEQVGESLRGVNIGGVVISILAGTPSSAVRRVLGVERVVRVMPNTPAQIGLGVTAIGTGKDSRESDLALAEEVFRAVGPIVERIDECLVDAFTGVAGSGPAYAFYLAEGMIRGAVESGLEPGLADRIVRGTLLGAASLLAASDEDAGELRRRVTSPGGTTAAAIGVLDEAGGLDAIARAVVAAKDRGQELGA